MNVLVAGATGALGRQLAPPLVAAGHEVVGMARSASREEASASWARPPSRRCARSRRVRSRVARTLLAWRRQGARIDGATVRQVEVNGQPGALVLDPDNRLISALALDIADGQIRRISSIVNPDKLAHLGPVSDLRALLARHGEMRAAAPGWPNSRGSPLAVRYIHPVGNAERRARG